MRKAHIVESFVATGPGGGATPQGGWARDGRPMLFEVVTPGRPRKLLALVLGGEAKNRRGERMPMHAWVVGEELAIPWLCWCGLERPYIGVEDGDRPFLFASYRWEARAQAASTSA